MKIGNLVRLKEGYSFEPHEKDIYYRAGVIIMAKEYTASGLWYKVQWMHDTSWHTPGDLELLNEN
jgi:hypothetical protein